MTSLSAAQNFGNFGNFGDFNTYGNQQQDTPDLNDVYGADINNEIGDPFGDTPDAVDTPDAADFDIWAMAAAAGQVAGEQAAVPGGDSSGPDSGESMAGGSFVAGFGNAGGAVAEAGADAGDFGGMGGFIGNPGNDFNNDQFEMDPSMLHAAHHKRRGGNGASVGIAIATIALVVGAATIAIVVIRRQRQFGMTQLA